MKDWTYRGKNIRKAEDGRFEVGGYLITFGSLREAKDAIDAAWAEDEALRKIDEYVRDEFGGYM